MTAETSGMDDRSEPGVPVLTVVIAAVAAGIGIGAVLGGPVFSSMRAASAREVLFRLLVWLVMAAAAAIVIGQIWQLPQGHPAAN